MTPTLTCILPMIDNSIKALGYLEIEGLSKRFDDVMAVDNVSLEIAKGEIFALLGSSGCGKSTLLRLLAGFETPTAGAIYLGGKDIIPSPPYERPINMMFQSYALFPHLSVWENIAFGLKRMKMEKNQVAKRVGEMLELVQLQHFDNRKPHQLSGGQQQRVALARSLARNPQLLLLDEPLGALDKKLRQETQFELVNIIESVGVTCVVVTHDQQEAMSMATRIAVMSQGSILQVGTPSEIYELPNCRFVADFIGDINLIEGTVADVTGNYCGILTVHSKLHVALPVTEKHGTAVVLAIRPEKIQISISRPNQSLNVVQGKVLEIAYLGSYITYVVSLADGSRLEVMSISEVRSVGGAIQWSDDVFCWWDPAAARVLSI